MTLPSENVALVLQLNLGLHDKQEDIISELNILAWRAKTSWVDYRQTIFVINKEEERAQCHTNALKRALQQQCKQQ